MRRAGAVTAPITAIGASLSQAAARGRPVVHEIAPCDPIDSVNHVPRLRQSHAGLTAGL